MIRKLMASSAVLALVSAGALTVAQAQTDPAAPATESAPVQTELAASQEALTPEQPTLASIYIGRPVFASDQPDSDNIGDVNDLIVGEDGKISHAVVGVGGFLGIGEKDVAVPFDELQVVQDDNGIRLVYASTREQLEAAPALDRNAFDPTAVPATDTAANDAATGEVLAPTDEQMAAAPASTEATAPAEEQLAEAPAATDPTVPAVEPAPAETMATAPADAAAPSADATQELAATSSETAPATDQPADATQDMAATTSEPAPATDQPADATSDMAASSSETAPTIDEPADATRDMAANQETTDAGTDQAGQDVVAAAASDTAVSGTGPFLTFSSDQIQASDLIGSTVYSGEENIGEVSDLVLQEDGETRAALIDVGGFLGIGEKTVAIPFQDLQISQEPEDQGGGERITVAMSREQLEQLPAAEVPTQEPVADQAALDQPVTDQSADVTQEPVTDQAALDQPAIDPSSDASGTEPMPLPADQTAGSDPVDTTGEIVTGSVETNASYALASQDVSANDLIGSIVYGPDDANLGEISDVVFDKDGMIDAVIVDVGGFLGIGEKPVAVGFDQLNVRKDESGNLLAMVNSTKDQLDQAPAYQEPLPTGEVIDNGTTGGNTTDSNTAQ